MGKRKILIITNHSYMLWQFRRELIEALMQENEVVLSMPFVGRQEAFMAMGLKCVDTALSRRGVNPAAELCLMHTYDALLKAERPDLVITYSIKPNIYAGMMCEKNGIPFCANVQGLGTAFQSGGLAGFVTLLYRRALRDARVVFFENRENAAEFQRRGIVPGSRAVVLPGAGINLDRFAYQPYPENGRVHFLYLGRLMREKGMEELFQAAIRLADEGEPFFLDLVGFFEDGYQDAAALLEKRGIAKFHGFREDPRPFYAGADCVVLPSYHEGMSNVLLEAAAVGRPLIATDIPGCREAVCDGRTGFLVPARDTGSLYAAMKRMLRLAPSRRAEMGRLGREKMAREFPKETVVARTLSAITSGAGL